MSHIIIAVNRMKSFPLIVAANRDDDASKEARKISIVDEPKSPFIGALCKNNTPWIGANKKSLFMAYTRHYNNLDDHTPCEMFIANTLLKCTSIDDMVSCVEEINASKFPKFNLVFGSKEKVFFAQSYILHSMVIKQLNDGIHIISDNMVFDAPTAHSNYVHKKLNAVSEKPWIEYYKLMKRVLANSEYGLKTKLKKKEGKFNGFATTSSTILAWDETGLSRFKHYDRLAPRDHKGGKVWVPQYIDYIDLWRGSAPNGGKSEEDEGEEEKDDDRMPFESPKNIISNAMKERILKEYAKKMRDPNGFEF